MNTKNFEVKMTVKALVNNNKNFPPNAHAIEIVAMMCTDALSHCFRLQGKTKDETLIKFLEGKIKAYESILESLK